MFDGAKQVGTCPSCLREECTGYECERVRRALQIAREHGERVFAPGDRVVVRQRPREWSGQVNSYWEGRRGTVHSVWQRYSYAGHAAGTWGHPAGLMASVDFDDDRGPTGFDFHDLEPEQ